MPYLFRNCKVFIAGVFIVCWLNSVQSQNIVYSYAGNGTQGFINGDTSMSRFKNPFGMCMDKNGNLIVADAGNNCIRKITTQGVVSTLAGTGVAGFSDGAASSAQFNSPSGVCADDSGNVYVADFQNQRIRKISTGNVVTTVAGSGIAGYLDGGPSISKFNYPRGICIDKDRNLYVGDSWNHRIRKIDSSGNVSTFAGGGSAMGVSSVGSHKDGADTSARFYTPAGLGIDQDGNIFVADAYNHRIRKISPIGIVTTVAGSGNTGVGNGGYADGNVISALLNTPTEVFSDSLGDIYVGDTFNNRIRKISNSNVYTIAGDGGAGYLNGNSSTAKFNYPRGLVKRVNTIYVNDYNNHTLRGILLSAVTSVSDVKKNEIRIVDNFNQSVEVFLPESGIATFLVRDVKGSKIIEGKENTDFFSIDLSTFSKGLYLLEIVYNGKHYNQKILITR